VTSTGETVYGWNQCRPNTDYRKEINSARDGLVNAQTCSEGTFLSAPLSWDDGYSIRELDNYTNFTRQTCELYGPFSKTPIDPTCMVSRTTRNDIDSEVQACATICQASSACTGFYVTQSGRYICTTYEGSDKLASHQYWSGSWRFYPRTNHIVTSTGETVYGWNQCRPNTFYTTKINSARDGLVTCPGDQNSKRSGGVSCQCAEEFGFTDGTTTCLVNQDNTKYTDSATGEIKSCPDIITTQELIRLQFGATVNTDHDNIPDEAVATNYDGTIIAVGMPEAPGSGVYNFGNTAKRPKVVVYKYDIDVWKKMGEVADIYLESHGCYGTKTPSLSYTRFGSSISLSDDGMTIAVGSPRSNEFIPGCDACGCSRYSDDRIGRMFIYRYYNGGYHMSAQLLGIKLFVTGGEKNILFGHRVELSGDGNSVVVSAKGGHTYDSGQITEVYTGYVQVYRSWNQIGWFTGLANERIGDDVSISYDGNIIAYSAVKSNYFNGEWTYYGRVSVHRLGTTWEQLGSDIWGEAPGDNSGTSISLSADGTRIAIGAPYNDGAGSNAGHVRVWEYSSNTNTWTKMGSDIDGKGPNDYSGGIVSLSADGTRVAIRSGATGSNYVRVYEYSNSGWNQIGFNMGHRSPMALSGDGYRVATLQPSAKDLRVYAAGGSYAPTTAAEVCTNCPAGKISNGPFTTMCINCPAGKSSEVGSNTCTDCPADKISRGDGGVCRCNDGMFDYNNICIPQNTDNTKYIDSVTGDLTSCPDVITQELINLQIGTTQQGSYDSYGYSTATSHDGTIVAVGTPEYGNGRVTIYQFENNAAWVKPAWVKLGNDIIGEADGDKFGRSISLSDDGMTIAIGATSAKHDGRVVGHVRVYYYTNGDWSQKGDDIHGDDYFPNTNPNAPYYPEDFGYSVSLSGNGRTVAASATYGHNESSYYTGYVAVRAWSDHQNDWVRKGVNIVGTTPWEMSGSSVSLSYDGNTVAIGSGKSYWTGSSWNNTGRVRVFVNTNITNPEWEQVGDDIAGESINDYSGQSVSLSADGTRVAIDGQYNDGAAGMYSGHVRVWEYSNNAWTKMGSDIDGEAAYDYSGGGVSLSADGTRVAIGSQWNDGNGESSGHVRVYEYSDGNWNQLGIDIDGVTADDQSFVVSLSGDGTRVAIGAKNAGYMRVFAVGGSYAPTTAAEVCTTCPAGKLSIDGLTCIDMANQPTCTNVVDAYDDAACTRCAPTDAPVTICGPGTTWSNALKKCIGLS